MRASLARKTVAVRARYSAIVGVVIQVCAWHGEVSKASLASQKINVLVGRPIQCLDKFWSLRRGGGWGYRRTEVGYLCRSAECKFVHNVVDDTKPAQG